MIEKQPTNNNRTNRFLNLYFNQNIKNFLLNIFFIRNIKLDRTVVFLGLASFFTDISSEMIYPLLPVFIISVLGGSQFSLGIIEGFAEATAAILKWASGFWADKIKSRKKFIFWGYSISSFIRPMVCVAQTWPVVFGLRFLDRVGKGIRTSPRDALIAEVTPENERGAAYGFHRSMDHAGAVLGPLVASGLLWLGFSLRQVFAWAWVPAILAVAVILFGVKEKLQQPKSENNKMNSQEKPSGNENVAVINNAAENAEKKLNELYSKDFKFLMIPIFIFSLANTTDTFLLVKLSQSGVESKWIPILWSLLHIVKMISTFWGGRLADRFNKFNMLGMGWFLFSLVYAFFGYLENIAGLVFVFLVYGLFFGLSEPSERAIVSIIANKKRMGSSFGIFNFSVGLAALPANLIFGWAWSNWGGLVSFGICSVLSLLASGFIVVWNNKK